MKRLIVDAFADRRFAGNPAAVCLFEKEQGAVWMQAVATRPGFEVAEAESIIAAFRDHDVENINDLKQTQWRLRAVVKDPDAE